MKKARSDARKALYRGMVRSRARTYVKKVRTLLSAGKITEAAQALRDAVRALDKAAEKGVIHKNNAARRKSRLMTAFNKAKGQLEA